MTNKEETKGSFLWVTYSQEFECGGEAIDPEDQWTSYEPVYYSWDLGDVFLSDPPSTYNKLVRCGSLIPIDPDSDSKTYLWKDLDKKEGERVWVVFVIYSTGDTFSESYGNGEIVCVCKDEDSALIIKKEIWEGQTPQCISYASWNGYFESIQNVTVEKKIIQG